MNRLICMLLLALTGCADFRNATRSSLTQDEQVMVISRARTLALESGLVKESERTVVEFSEPKMAYYFLSGVHYAQYFITWKFSEDEGLTVSGQGKLLTLDGANIKRLQHTAVPP